MANCKFNDLIANLTIRYKQITTSFVFEDLSTSIQKRQQTVSLLIETAQFGFKIKTSDNLCNPCNHLIKKLCIVTKVYSC